MNMGYIHSEQRDGDELIFIDCDSKLFCISYNILNITYIKPVQKSQQVMSIWCGFSIFPLKPTTGCTKGFWILKLFPLYLSTFYT